MPVSIRVGGVPEHFNSPWHQAIASGEFTAAGLDVSWTDYSLGTGAMCKAVASGEIDVAVVLTEGVTLQQSPMQPDSARNTIVRIGHRPSAIGHRPSAIDRPIGATR